QAREAISFRFLADYGELLYLSKIKNTKPENRDKARQLYIMSDRIAKKIIYGIQKGDVDESIRFAEDFLAMLKEHKFAGKMLLRSFFADILGGLSIVPDDIKYINMCEAVWDEDKFTADFSNLESFSQTRQYVAWFLRSIAACVGNRKNREENIAKKVIRIIEARYTEELDLDLVSGEMNLSPYYIGKIFKRYTGSTFSKYLNEYKINKAKEMLLSGKIKVYDLGGKIGIQNSSYFCALFKSKFGISPGEYRKLLKGMQKGV
ncbi:MAG: helix-turn-helix domain-containing protein, partial [Bacillota bacterium]